MRGFARRAALVGVFLLGSSGTVLACGQMSPVSPTPPGTEIVVYGYGYGYEGGDRPVALVWAETGEMAGHSGIDANGNFAATVVAPDTPGLHRLIARQREDDPAPTSVTVPVASPAT